MDDLTTWLLAALDDDMDFGYREIQIKRRLVELHSADSDFIPVCKTCSCAGALGSAECFETVAWPCETIKLVAASFSDRPGYQDSWRP